jgi:endonuclease/exonuclease/phosphatase family metal-dependent hydrolase
MARWDLRWRGRILIILVLGVVALVTHDSLTEWDLDTLGPHIGDESPLPLEEDELRVVTWNAWRLHARERVPALVAAIDRVGGELALGEARPELVTIQEIESFEALRSLERRFGKSGFFGACRCATNPDGTLRSAVAVAVRSPLVVRAHECIPLPGIFPDHPRCAVLARVVDESGRELDFVGVHLAWHVFNVPMADRLRRELMTRGALGPNTILAGDFNAWPGTDAFERMTQPPLRDARPGAFPTHFLGFRLDYVLVGNGFEVVRGINRHWSFDALAPAARFTLPRACAHHGPPTCPYSDHLPEAVVLRFRDSTLSAERQSQSAKRF